MSSSDSDSSSSDHHHTATTTTTHLETTIFSQYLSSSSPSPSDLSKIRSFLATSNSNALSCMICLERIRVSDPTWSCQKGCYAVFHLQCIQSWARSSADAAVVRAAQRLSRDLGDGDVQWGCPKCRVEYSRTSIPKDYYCFCGKEVDPKNDPWILPHSCGEICGRALRNDCGHHCLLLCHPGPCPSCPKLIKARCYCGGVEDVKRCGFKRFSCNGVCMKVLECGEHWCKEVCHEEEQCLPCKERGVYRCECGKGEMEMECWERVWRCERECGGMLECGRHKCERGCHMGKCGGCPLEGKRGCPCGKKVYEGVTCDVVLPTCGSTCEKMLGCGFHKCPERCHRGKCIETCRRFVMKSCRCGSLKKEVPCFQGLACERKCQGVRDCGRHACKRRCCDGDCPPCLEVCGRKLRCNNHKCPSPCHRGPCAPCPLMVTIGCACGETYYEVPCGSEADKKPPKCSKPCSVSYLCRHSSYRKSHKCHYGACPPCRLPCDEDFSCGHKCNLRCHDPKPAPKPEFTLKPRTKKSKQKLESTLGSPCPPCPELVWRLCLGQHIGAERMMVCSDKAIFSCDNLCGNLLACSNHHCTRTCHALNIQSSRQDQDVPIDLCEICDLPCQKERKLVCPHPCPLPCHPGDCPSCSLLIKRSCHCGSMVHALECTYYNSLPKEDQHKIRSCGGPCHRKLTYCSHLCPEKCHPGQCPLPDKCAKKVNVRCGCQNLKKEWLCKDVQTAYRNTGRDPRDIFKNQFGVGVLPCDSTCAKKVKAVDPELHLRKPKVLEKEEPDTVKLVPKRRKRRNRGHEATESSRLEALGATLWRCFIFISIIFAVITAAYCGYKGLLWISDWMNELDEQRPGRIPSGSEKDWRGRFN